MYRCLAAYALLLQKRGCYVKRDAAVKKQSDEHRFRTADFHLAVVISGREMSVMFGRVTFSYRFVLTFLSHVAFMFSFGFH